MRENLLISQERLQEINHFLADPSNKLINELVLVVEKYGTVEEINERAKKAKELPNLMAKLKNMDSPYYKDLIWLEEKRDQGAFVSVSEYRRNIIGEEADRQYFNEGMAVTLEISALQYFPWLVEEAKQAIEKKEMMPGRYIRVRKMKESEEDQGDLIAIAAAMQIVGASYVETLDTKGTDGSNVHLGGPETITGYFGGIGQPNDHVLKWVDELLYYYTRYGIDQVLNINPGTVFAAYMLYKMGIDISFKISVFMGNDNPYSVFWTLMMAKLFAREDGTTPLKGFNLSNSVNNRSIELSAMARKQLDLESQVRIEHHITETFNSIVRQPYNRRDELLELAEIVANIAAKHEGNDPEEEEKLETPSSILHYFRDKEEVLESGEMELLKGHYLGKHAALNRTAEALTRKNLSFIAARNLHKR